MKLSLALGRRDDLDPAKAWACVATNLAMPGFGSLMGGRVSGYPQAALTLAAFTLTTVFGMRFVVWAIKNWSQIQDPADPVSNLMALWVEARWALLGILVFAFSWVWALATGYAIVAAAKRTAALTAGSDSGSGKGPPPPPRSV